MSNFSFNDLKDKVCVITGGSGVIGTALCEALAAAGTNLAILDLNRKNTDDLTSMLCKKYGTGCFGVEGNVLDKESLENAKKEINDRFGEIDILINGAGGNSPQATTQFEQLTPDNINDLEKSFFGLTTEGFDQVFDLNFKGTLLPTMVFGQDMIKKQKGVILNISSMNSYKPLTKIPAYSAAKSAINNFTQWLAVHFAKAGIRVNAIAPGFFLTKQNQFLLTDEKTGEPTPRGQKIIANTPMGKYGEPEDLQGTMLYLLSDVSSFVTGIVIPVDGGYSAFGGV